MNIPLLDPTKEHQHNTWRLLYAEMMFSWGLFEARAELLKFLSLMKDPVPPPLPSRHHHSQYSRQNRSSASGANRDELTMSPYLPPSAPVPTALERILGIDRHGLEIAHKCFECDSMLSPPDFRCDFCQKHRQTIKCSICHLSVRGRTSGCLKCSHGGHADHLLEWFVQEKNTVCPTGCGCECLVNYGGWTGGLVVKHVPRNMLPQESL